MGVADSDTRWSRRIFDTTTEETSNVGRPGKDNDGVWEKWYAKYRAPLVKFIEFKYSRWKDEAPDVVQCVAAMIAGDPYITDRGEDDRYRTVLCNLCTKVICARHNGHRMDAEAKYARHRYVEQQPTRDDRVREREKLLDFIAIIRDNLLNKKYDVERYFPNIDGSDLDLWREVQGHEENVSATARDLGLDRRTIQSACGRIELEIRSRAEERARVIGYFD